MEAAKVSDYADRLRESIPEAVLEAEDGIDAGVLLVRPERIVEVSTLLRDGFGFDLLADLSAVDWLPREPRFDVNYHLAAAETPARLRLKAQLPGAESPQVPSVVGVWPTANWHEREVYDMFGIVFEGHPDLRRILMPDEWIGHPLRKDYPVGGVPVEYRIEPAYIGPNVVPAGGRPAAGGMPVRLRRDRGRPSTWTWTGPPAAGMPRRGREEEVELPAEDPATGAPTADPDKS